MNLYVRTPRDELPLEYILDRLERLASESDAEQCAALLAARNRIWRRERGELWTASGTT